MEPGAEAWATICTRLSKTQAPLIEPHTPPTQKHATERHMWRFFLHLSTSPRDLAPPQCAFAIAFFVVVPVRPSRRRAPWSFTLLAPQALGLQVLSESQRCRYPSNITFDNPPHLLARALHLPDLFQLFRSSIELSSQDLPRVLYSARSVASRAAVLTVIYAPGFWSAVQAPAARIQRSTISSRPTTIWRSPTTSSCRA